VRTTSAARASSFHSEPLLAVQLPGPDSQWSSSAIRLSKALTSRVASAAQSTSGRRWPEMSPSSRPKCRAMTGTSGERPAAAACSVARAAPSVASSSASST
jgi:hypothetical protein